MATPFECARYTQDSGNVASVPVTVSAACPVGSHVILAVNAPAVNLATGFTASDNKGNTYTQLQFATHATAANGQMSLFDMQVTTALAIGDTITVACTGRSPGKWAVIAICETDITAYDVSAKNTGSGSAVDSGTTAAAAQNQELLVFAAGFTDSAGADTMTDAGWTQLPKAVASAASAPKSLILAWQQVNAAGTRHTIGTLSGSEAWVGIIGAFKQSVAPPPATNQWWLNTGSGFVAMDMTIK